MEEKMKILIALQDCDTRMKRIQIKRMDGPKKVQRLKQGLTEVENQLAQEANLVEAYLREKRQTEQGIEGMEDSLKKANVKLSNIKSNKEYQAALKEIEDLEKEKSLLEDRVIEIMEELETLEAKCTVSKKKTEEMKRQFEIDRDETERMLEALDRDLDELDKERTRYSQAVDAVLLRRYNSLRKNKGGIGVSSVVKGVCQTCHLGIPPQEFNELIRGDKLMSCPNCTRIIYWGDDERYQNDRSD